MWLIGAGRGAGWGVDGEVPPPGRLSRPVGGTGIVTAATFLWAVCARPGADPADGGDGITVLILLGLRWLPPRIESIAGPPQPPWQVMDATRARPALAVGAAASALAALYAVLVHSGSGRSRLFLLNGSAAGQQRVNVAGGFPQLRHLARSPCLPSSRSHRVCVAAPLRPAPERRHPAQRASTAILRAGRAPANRLQRLPDGAGISAPAAPSWG